MNWYYAAEAAQFKHTTVDFSGREATNGQYLIPLGANLGGVEWSAEWSEINLAAFQTPFPFTATLHRVVFEIHGRRTAADVEAQARVEMAKE